MEDTRKDRPGDGAGTRKPAGPRPTEAAGTDRFKSRCFAAALAAATLLAPPALAQRLGVVADNETDSVIVFEADDNSVLGAVRIGPGDVGDVAVTPDQTLAFATDFQQRVWVIDLTAAPPALAAGTNPIAISNPGSELTVTPDGRFLLVNNGAGPVQPISVVDIAARVESSTLTIGSDIVSNDICDDGRSVLVASSSGQNVRRLVLAADGTLSDSGEALALGGTSRPLNVYCAPGSKAGLVVTFTDPTFRSFTVAGLAPVDTVKLLGNGNSAVFSAAGDRVFVRSGNPGSLEAFDFDPATGAVGAEPRDTVLIASASAFFGVDRLALGPDGDTLYVPEGAPVSAVSVIDAANLAGPLVDSISRADIVDPTGVAFARVTAFDAFEALEVALEIDEDEEFELDSEFTLGAASDGIDPATEEVTLEIAGLSVTIPAGSFRARYGSFVFNGDLAGGEFELRITPLGADTYRLYGEIEDLDLGRLKEPVTVVLTVGDDRSETIAAVEFDD